MFVWLTAYTLTVLFESARLRFLASHSGKTQTWKQLLAELAAKSNDLFLAFSYNYFFSITRVRLKVILCMARNTG